MERLSAVASVGPAPVSACDCVRAVQFACSFTLQDFLSSLAAWDKTFAMKATIFCKPPIRYRLDESDF